MSERLLGDSRDDANRVAVIGLTARFHLPHSATPRTRDTIPPGYGVQEQCLPFTAAAALGILIPAPFAWGFCPPDEAPIGSRRFRSPVPCGCPVRVFYVVDDPAHGFAGNRFEVPDDVLKRTGPAPLPGISFFDRDDQQDHVKVHLPYVFKTSSGISLFFTAPVNRPRSDRLVVVSGLVECDVYMNAVNLVLQLPPMPSAVHVAAGTPLAQAIPIDRMLQRPTVDFVASHRREARQMYDGISDWRNLKASDRSAYKRLARSAHGRLVEEDRS